MGITGLIPFLSKASKQGNISEFAGGTVAIDSYCWLHRGAFSCADKIVMGQPTDAHVKYCMRLVHMLLANRIRPIMVFDGRHLPAKKATEVKRRENRETTRRRAVELMKMGQNAEGRNMLRKCVDITHELALQLIKKCQEENVDCIVAPYEADAQLAYLNVAGIADVIITEDSDLTLFGCKKIFFKMDVNGNGLLVEQDRLHLAMNVRAEHFQMDKFRYMCILSGCDYLPSLPGIGLAKACKFILKNTEEDIHKALVRLGSHLNMKALVVTKEYRDAFIRALVTFKHQMVYCPLQRKQVRLNPPSADVTVEQLQFAGEEISEEDAYQLALGNYDPFTMKQLHNYDPDRPQRRKTNSWHEKTCSKYVSIWSKDYKVSEEKENRITGKLTKWPNTAGKIITMNTEATKEKTNATPKKRHFTELVEELTAKEALDLYGNNKLSKNEDSAEGRITPPSDEKSSILSDNEKSSSPVRRKANPFAKSANDSQLSPSLVCRGKRRIKLKNLVGFRPTIIDERIVETSKYFPSEITNKETDNEKPETTEYPIFIENPMRNGKFIVEDKSAENRETNFIEEILSQDEDSSSSGVFSSGPISQENMPTRIKHIFDKEQAEDRADENSSDFRKILNIAKHKFDNPSNDISPSSAAEWGNEENNGNDKNNDNLKCSLFKWAHTKNPPKLNAANSSLKNKSSVIGKVKSTKKMTCRIESLPVERQQSLLNMFGFQRKSVLKHSLTTSIEKNDAMN